MKNLLALLLTTVMFLNGAVAYGRTFNATEEIRLQATPVAGPYYFGDGNHQLKIDGGILKSSDDGVTFKEIGNPQGLATTDSPTFAGVTADNLTLGVVGANILSSLTGVVEVKPNGTSAFVMDLSGGQEYHWNIRGTVPMTVVGQTAGSAGQLELYSKDSDGTDATAFRVFGKGTPAQVEAATVAEYLEAWWNNAASVFEISVKAIGTGVQRALSLEAGTDNQLYIDTDGEVGIGKVPSGAALDVNGAIAASTSVTGATVNGGNLRATSNTLSSTDANGNIILDPNGTGNVVLTDQTASRAVVLDASKNLTSHGTVDTTELGYLDGVTSAVQTQLNAKLDDFASTNDNRVVRTNGTAGDAVQESTVVLDDLGAMSGLTLVSYQTADLEELGATPSNPSAGRKKIYCKTDGNCYQLNSSGVEAGLGSGGGGANFLTNGGFESGVANTFTANAGDAVALETTQKISGGKTAKLASAGGATYDYEWVLTNTNLAGKEVDVSCIVQSTSTAINFCSTNDSGSGDSCDNYLPSTSVNAAGVPVRIYRDLVVPASGKHGIRITSDSSITTPVYVDDCVVYEKAINVGPAIGEWQSFTPTATDFGTISSAVGKWRRVGDSMEVEGSFVVGTPGSAGQASIELPSGYLIDTTKISGGNQNALGVAFRVSSANTYDATGITAYLFSDASDTDSVFVSKIGSSNGVMGKGAGDSVSSAGVGIAFKFTVPIKTWTSSTQFLTQEAPKAIEVEWSGTGCNFGLGNTADGGENIIFDSDCAATVKAGSFTSFSTGTAIGGHTILPVGRYDVCWHYAYQWDIGVNSGVTQVVLGETCSGTSNCATTGTDIRSHSIIKASPNVTGVTNIGKDSGHTMCGVLSVESAVSRSFNLVEKTIAVDNTVSSNLIPSAGSATAPETLRLRIQPSAATMVAALKDKLTHPNTTSDSKAYYARLDCDSASSVTNETFDGTVTISNIGTPASGQCRVTVDSGNIIDTARVHCEAENIGGGNGNRILHIQAINTTTIDIGCSDHTGSACATFGEFSLKCENY